MTFDSPFIIKSRFNKVIYLYSQIYKYPDKKEIINYQSNLVYKKKTPEWIMQLVLVVAYCYQS